jgi:hypothetical protein
MILPMASLRQDQPSGQAILPATAPNPGTQAQVNELAGIGDEGVAVEFQRLWKSITGVSSPADFEGR